jgi:hypothetical protein
MSSIKRPFPVLLFVVASSITSSVDSAKATDVVGVSVPSMTQWCLARPAAISDVSDPAFQQAEIGAVMLAIGKAGAAIGVPELGVPSVDHTDKIDDANVNITYCANMDTTKSPPAQTKISTQKRPALQVVGKPCNAAATIDICEADVVAALQNAPWNIPPDKSTQFVHFVSAVPDTGSVESRVMAAANNAHSHIYDPSIGLVIVKPTTEPQTTVLALGLP